VSPATISGALLVGSEGTLAFSAGLRSSSFRCCCQEGHDGVFSDVSKASETVSAIIATGSSGDLEFMDNFTIRAVEDFAHVGLPIDAAALLLIEVDGHPVQVEESAKVEDICKRMGALNIRVARDAQSATEYGKPAAALSAFPA